MFKTNTLLLALSLVAGGSFSAPVSARYQTAIFSSQAASNSFCQSHYCFAQYVADYKSNSPARYVAIYSS